MCGYKRRISECMQWSYIPQEKTITRATNFCLTEREAVGWYTYMNFSKINVMATEKNGLDICQTGNRRQLGAVQALQAGDGSNTYRNIGSEWGRC